MTVTEPIPTVVPWHAWHVCPELAGLPFTPAGTVSRRASAGTGRKAKNAIAISRRRPHQMNMLIPSFGDDLGPALAKRIRFGCELGPPSRVKTT